VEDEGRPFGVALRGEAPNRPLLHWLKTVVVSDVGKGALDVSGGDQEDGAQPFPCVGEGSLVKCRNG